MFLAMMAAITSEYLDLISLVVPGVIEIFLIDLIGHFHHLSCNVLFRFFVACKVHLPICSRHMAKITFHSQATCERVHNTI